MNVRLGCLTPGGERSAPCASVAAVSGTSLRLIVNGEPRTESAPLSISSLVSILGLTGVPVAVEVNRRVIPRSQHDSETLADGDTIEVVTFVGGG